MTPVGHKIYFGGGAGENGHQGVGVAIHKRLLHQIDSIFVQRIYGQSLPIAIESGLDSFRCLRYIFRQIRHWGSGMQMGGAVF